VTFDSGNIPAGAYYVDDVLVTTNPTSTPPPPPPPVASVTIAPSNPTVVDGQTVQLTATPRDAAGNPLSGRATTWATSSAAVATVSSGGRVVGEALGSATITATSEGVDGSTGVTVIAAPTPDPTEPFFDPGDPTHVSHIYEDWSTYATVGAIATTNRVDGGRPWGVSNVGGLSFETPGDPYGSAKTLTLDYTRAVTGSPPNTYGNGLEAHNYAGGNSRWLNVTGTEEVIILEWAARFSGSNMYIGKTMDYWQGGLTGNGGRWNYDPSYSNLGDEGPCDNNVLCTRYWTNAGQTRTALATALKSPPTSGTWAPLFSHNTNEQLWGPTSIYKQNMNWGTGPGEFAWGSRGDRMHDNVWRRFKWRLTKSQPGVTNPLTGTQNGYGRVEMWVDGVKIMEYLGDVGARDEGLVFVGPRQYALISNGINLHVYDLTATFHPGDSRVHLGYIRAWSHNR
jgi:hypothetical protein